MAKYKVTATSQGKVRTEIIDASKNVLFKRAKNERDVQDAYESFWALDKYSPKVRVLKVRKMKKPLLKGLFKIKRR